MPNLRIFFGSCKFCPEVEFRFFKIVAACSSIGLLFSAYQCNAFVSVGLVGMSLFCGLSYLPMDTIVSIIGMITMSGTMVFSMYPPAFNYAWGDFIPHIGNCFVRIFILPQNEMEDVKWAYLNLL